MSQDGGPASRPDLTTEGHRVVPLRLPGIEVESLEREDGTWRATLLSTHTDKSLTLVSPRGSKLRMLAFEAEPTSSRVEVSFQDDNWNNGHSLVLGSIIVPLKSDLLVSALSILLEVITRRFVFGHNTTDSPTERPSETPASEAPGVPDTAPVETPPEPTS